MTEGELSISKVGKTKNISDCQERSEEAKFQTWRMVRRLKECHTIRIIPQMKANIPMPL